MADKAYKNRTWRGKGVGRREKCVRRERDREWEVREEESVTAMVLVWGKVTPLLREIVCFISRICFGI